LIVACSAQHCGAQMYFSHFFLIIFQRKNAIEETWMSFLQVGLDKNSCHNDIEPLEKWCIYLFDGMCTLVYELGEYVVFCQWDFTKDY